MRNPAEKQRRYRERQREGIIVLSVEVNEADLTAYLEQHRLIDGVNADDRLALGRAASRALQLLAAPRRR